VISEISRLHLLGKTKEEICEQLNIKKNTLEKAISQKRIVLPDIDTEGREILSISTKSSRNISDDKCGMGKSCSNQVERVLASREGFTMSPSFENHLDLNHAGLLLAVPALLSCGLLDKVEKFESVKGYYSAEQIFICLAFLSLLRVKKLEQSGEIYSGELGRCMGLDRIPDVKTLRKRITSFCKVSDVEQWSSELSRQWMHNDTELEGALYVDGHVSLYYGEQTQMPKRFVSRMRLCLSGSTDYWVNDQLGQPLFVAHKTINEGMIAVLKNDIIPRLDKDVPNQPTKEELDANPLLHRYMLVFDREGYSVDFFDYLTQKRIAFCSYRKNVKEDWSPDEFTDYEVLDANGDIEHLRLAEQETILSAKKEKGKPQKTVTVREIRKLSASGHQTSIITTNYSLSIVKIAILMFTRWCQENFFKYMIESFGIDAIISYMKNPLPDTSMIINPQYSALDHEHRQISALLSKAKKNFADITLQNKELSEKELKIYTQKKSNKKQEIEDLDKKRQNIIELKKSIDKKIMFKDLDDALKFDTALNDQKFFIDTIKIIAYRAETALVNFIKHKMPTPEHARALVRKFYSGDADIVPDYTNNILFVKLHRTNHWADDKILETLCEDLNQTQTMFPSSNLMLVFMLV
jgi:hypothetical protein